MAKGGIFLLNQCASLVMVLFHPDYFVLGFLCYPWFLKREKDWIKINAIWWQTHATPTWSLTAKSSWKVTMKPPKGKKWSSNHRLSGAKSKKNWWVVFFVEIMYMARVTKITSNNPAKAKPEALNKKVKKTPCEIVFKASTFRSEAAPCSFSSFVFWA